MRLDEAIKRGRQLVKELPTEDAAVVHCLVEMAARVKKAAPAVRTLADAIAPKSADHLNQKSLF